jgi:mannose-6-phosphate isomerase-like protein (cupin superfamily)
VNRAREDAPSSGLRRAGLLISEATVLPFPGMVRAVSFSIVLPEQLEWTTRPHEPDEPARHVAELHSQMRFEGTRANVWRYEPGARGRRHVHSDQEEIFVVIAGRLTMYLGEPPQRHVVPVGGIVLVRPGTPLQTVNEADEDLVVYAYGAPPDEGAQLLPPAA